MRRVRLQHPRLDPVKEFTDFVQAVRYPQVLPPAAVDDDEVFEAEAEFAPREELEVHGR